MAFIVKIFEGLLAGNDDLQLCFYESVAKLRGAFLCHKNQANFYQTLRQSSQQGHHDKCISVSGEARQETSHNCCLE